ncbi:hypothetical protein BCV70DRAFT_118938 [Testicularia cyperi]|uniref:DUF1279 domain-containing protein n=1 Tax=Testicularia cyperi TaxID=1882483 RepID=A0A317XMZ9_9BASI|nr:hypothetical protein BCV70DRAFT_118938 [Testicularia cyperi]
MSIITPLAARALSLPLATSSAGMGAVPGTVARGGRVALASFPTSISPGGSGTSTSTSTSTLMSNRLLTSRNGCAGRWSSRSAATEATVAARGRFAWHPSSGLTGRFSAPSIRTLTTCRPVFQSSSPLSSSSASSSSTMPSSSNQQKQQQQQDREKDKDPREEEEEDPDQPNPKASLKERLKFLTRRYGWWALAVYMAASAVDLSLTFAAVHLLGAEHIKTLEARIRAYVGLEPRQDTPDNDNDDDDETAPNKHPPHSASQQKQKKDKFLSDSFWTELVLAYTIHKTLLLPVRVAFTAAVTPSFVKWLVRIGWARANHHVRAKIAAKAAAKAAAAKSSTQHICNFLPTTTAKSDQRGRDDGRE